VRCRDPQTGEKIWEGKNYRTRNPLNQFRNLLETKNYSWLGKAKRLVNTLQNKVKPDNGENQTNLD
jgi:hypothetical protein